MPDIDLRPFRLTDTGAVTDLCDWAWWPGRSAEGWRWLMTGPSGSALQGPAGWVIEREGEVVAFVGNFIQHLWWRGARFDIATGHSLLVRPDARGLSRHLLKTFVEQQALARYTFNCNALSAPLYGRYGMEPWPGELAGVKFVWRVDPVRVLTERVVWGLEQRRGFAGARAGERFCPARLWDPRPTGWGPGVRQLEAGDIGDAFDRFWASLVEEDRPVATRDAAALRWRFADPDLTRAPLLLGYEADGELAGYLLAFFSKMTQIEFPTLEIVDLVALRGHEGRAIPALVTSLVRGARSLGAARVRLSMVNPRLEPLVSGVAGARRIRAHDHAHVRFAETAPAELRADWYATPFDGDHSFCVRPPPSPISHPISARPPRVGRYRHDRCEPGGNTAARRTETDHAEPVAETLRP